MQNAEYISKRLVSGKVVSKTQMTPGHFRMGLLCPHVAHNSVPGQFVQVRVDRSYDPLLPRPLAVYRARGDEFEILFKLVGKGTRLLAEKRIGDRVDIMGPLGNGFPTDGDFQMAILIAGGMGIAGLMALAEAVRDRQMVALIGASTRDKIVGDKDLMSLGAEVHIATEDGTAGHRGMVSELIQGVLLGTPPRVACRIFACGPTPMLKAIARIAALSKIPAYVSLEERMACGVGVCLGCACQVVSSEKYKMVCTDGPVFDAREVAWQ